jgi:hypothetical protein
MSKTWLKESGDEMAETGAIQTDASTTTIENSNPKVRCEPPPSLKKLFVQKHAIVSAGKVVQFFDGSQLRGREAERRLTLRCLDDCERDSLTIGQA